MMIIEKTVRVEDVMNDVDYILTIVLEDGSLKFAGQGLKWRSNPLHPRGWKKLTTAQGYATSLSSLPQRLSDWNVIEIRVCERRSVFRCLSSYAILKQNHEGGINDG